MPVTIKNSVALNGRIQFDSPWSPHLLFTAPGVWYDPSDYSTLYQDSAGVTPVTAVEQSVGLLLDKSRGLVQGTSLGSLPLNAAPWVPTSVTVTANSVTGTTNGNNLALGGLTVGRWYKVSANVASKTGVTI
jgi:hypothetical protein